MHTHRWHYVDETERRKWQNPEAILQDIGVEPGISFLDIGCGQGFFAIPAAHLVGRQGRVYGLDADAAAINELRNRASVEGLHNLELFTGDAEDTLACQACGDIAFLGMVLHDFHDPDRVLTNVHRMLKPSGKLANLDWKKKETGFGPPVAKRFDEATASEMIRKAGFKVTQVKEAGEFFYLIIAQSES